MARIDPSHTEPGHGAVVSGAPRVVDEAANATPGSRIASPPIDRAETLALLAISLGAALLRAYRLDAADLWLDEANTVLVTSQPLGAMLAELRATDVHPPLFYLLVGVTLQLSWSELGLRALPYLFGVIAIPLVWLVARDLAGRWAGLTAAALAAVWAPLVAFSQEGRMYSLLAALELTAAWALIRALEGGGRRWWVAFTLCSTLALYTHNLAGLFLAAHVLAALWVTRRWRAPFVAGLVAGLLYLPWVPSALTQLVELSGDDGWLGPQTPLWIPALTLVNLLAGTELRHGLLSPRFVMQHAYLLAPACVLLFLGWRRLRARPVARRVFLGTALLPVLITLALSQITRIYVDKTFLVAALVMIVIAAAAAPRRPRRVEGLAILAAVLLLGAAQLWLVTANWSTPHETYRALVVNLSAARREGDLVVVTPPFIDRPLTYASRRLGVNLNPREVAVEDLEATFQGDAARVWIVTSGVWDPFEAADSVAEIAPRGAYQAIWQRYYPDRGLRLVLFERRG